MRRLRDVSILPRHGRVRPVTATTGSQQLKAPGKREYAKCGGRPTTKAQSGAKDRLEMENTRQPEADWRRIFHEDGGLVTTEGRAEREGLSQQRRYHRWRAPHDGGAAGDVRVRSGRIRKAPSSGGVTGGVVQMGYGGWFRKEPRQSPWAAMRWLRNNQ